MSEPPRPPPSRPLARPSQGLVPTAGQAQGTERWGLQALPSLRANRGEAWTPLGPPPLPLPSPLTEAQEVDGLVGHGRPLCAVPVLGRLDRGLRAGM